jgi:TonB family protein
MMDQVMQAALAISGAAFDSLWEGGLVCAVTWLGLLLLPRAGAATRYAIWLCALSAMVLIPAVTVLAPAIPRQSPAASAAPAEPIGPAAAPGPSNAAFALPAAEETPQTPRITVTQSAALAVAILWILAACARIALLLKNMYDLAVIRRETTPWGSAQEYPILLSASVDVPIAAGFLHPAIILPASIVWTEPDDALQAIVMHESAHIRRNDVWTNAFARILEAFVTLNPVAWFVLRRLAAEREIACDDWVVAKLSAGEVFARALAAMAGCAGARRHLAAPSAIGSRHSIVARIEHLLENRPRRLRLSVFTVGATLMLFAIVALVLQTVSPVLAFAPQSPPAIVAASGCATPNRGIRAYTELDTTNSVVRAWVPAVNVKKAVAGLGAQHVAIVDLTVNAAGKLQNVVTVSAPPVPDLAGRIARGFARETYEPALRDCRAVTSTVRVAAFVGNMRGAPRRETLSTIVPSYPAGWSVAHPSSCKVPNLIHSGVPALTPALAAAAARSSSGTSVRVRVNAAGSVTDSAVQRSSGNTSVDDAVVAAARAQTYPLAESTGFKPVRPSHSSLAWNVAHGYAVFSKCNPMPVEYTWTTTVPASDSLAVFPIFLQPGMKP